MLDPRGWSKQAWALAIAVVVLLVLANQVDIGSLPKSVRNGLASPTAAVIVALVSLIVTATSTAYAWRRQKRQATIEAWIAWSESTSAARKVLTTYLGKSTITQAQAQAFTNHQTVPDKDGQPLPNDVGAMVGNSMIVCLNGLERLAVGASDGVYETATLRKLGGTIIRRTYERFEPYIEARRTHADKTVRQARAYSALVELAADLQRHELDKDRLQQLSR